MTFIVSDDIREKCIQLISGNKGAATEPANQPASQYVCPLQTR